jgi:hypothetical protein
MAELLTGWGVGFADDGPGAVPDGEPFWMYMKRPSALLPQCSGPYPGHLFWHLLMSVCDRGIRSEQ